MPAVLDTHAWVWWVTEDQRLSKRAKRVIEEARADAALLLSLISLWEIAKKVQKGQLVLDRPVDDWLDVAISATGLQLVELTRPILVESCRLPAEFHGDPADQIIVATARDRSGFVITKDRQIRSYEHVRSVW